MARNANFEIDPQIEIVSGGGLVAIVDQHDHYQILSAGPLACHLEGDRFVFTGSPTGSHSIAAERLITGPKRLLAHWAGYCADAACAKHGQVAS